MKASIKHYAAAGYPAVAIATADEDRAITQVLADLPDRTVIRMKAGDAYPAQFQQMSKKAGTIGIVLDYQHVVRNPGAYRPLRDALPAIKHSGSMLILIAPSWNLPDELKHDIPVIHDALPERQELDASLETCVEATKASITPNERQALLDSASGLTLAEAENSFALSYAADGKFDPATVTEEKLKLVRQSGFLEVSMPADPESMGGMGELQRFAHEDIIPSADDIELMVRGIILCGVAGTGKSLFAKILGALLRRPVLRFDLSSLKGSLVGQTEQQVRSALRLAEAVSPCVLWIDEVDKGIGGYASSAQTDGGTTLGAVGIMLTWQQEHRSKIITVATCNDYSKLPAEFTRAGRFDERFFVDLPGKQERTEIAAVHLRRFGPVTLADHVAGLTEDWTGAEIEALVRAAARRTKRAVTAEALAECAKDIKPIARVRGEEIRRLRDWGQSNLRLANSVDANAPAKPSRKIAAPTPMLSHDSSKGGTA